MRCVVGMAVSLTLTWFGCSSLSERGGGRSDAGDPAGDSGSASDADGGGNVPAREGLRGGERLRPRFLVEQGAQDGEGLFVGWRDDELDLDCQFSKDTDGTFRCLPIESSGLRVYPDATCTAGTGFIAELARNEGDPLPDCSPRYVRYLAAPERCSETSAGGVVRIIGPSTASREAQRFVNSLSGACNAWKLAGSEPLPDGCVPENSCDPTRFDPGVRWVLCEYETPEPSRFVSAEVEVRDAGNVRQLVLHGEDGSREPRELLHPELDEPLMPDTWAGDSLVPRGTQWGILPAGYADEACSTPALCFPIPNAQPLPELVRVSGPECARTVTVDADDCSGTVYELGERIESPSFCGGDVPEAATLACYEQARVVEPIPIEELAMGAGRLRPLWLAQDGEPLAPTGFFEDRELGVQCVPSDSEDEGVQHCWPFPVAHLVIGGSGSGWQMYFADAACRILLGYGYIPSACGEPTPDLGFFLGDLVRLRSVGPPDRAEIFSGFSASPGASLGCMPAAERPAELFESEVLDDSVLARMEEVTR